MRRGWKRDIAKLLAVSMIFVNMPVYGAASAREIGGFCEHHRSHTEDCGYTEGTAGTPCSHERTEDCYALVTECVHKHTAGCYPEESGSEDTATPSEADKDEPTECGHACSEESRCIIKELDCQHEHKVNGGESDREDGLGRSKDCGYSPAEPGTPCTYVCEICYPQDGDRPGSTKPEDEKVSTPSDALEMSPEQMKAMKNVLAVENPVASVTIDGVETEYASLREAIENADGKTATVTLLRTANRYSEAYVNNGNITLQLNGFSFPGLLGINGGTVTITGSGTINKICILLNGSVTIKGGIVNKLTNLGSGTVAYEPSSISLNQSALSLNIGKASGLTVTVTPNISVPGFGYTWTSSDPSVATVAGNSATATVTAKKAGTATITVTAGDKTATCTVTVTEPQSSTVGVSITGTSVTENNGTYSAVYGSSVTVTADIAEASANAKTRTAVKNTVDFYLGSIADGNKLNKDSIAVTNNKAAIQLPLTGEKWNAGKTYTIHADFSGSDTLKQSSGSAKLTVTPAAINGTVSITGNAVPGNTLTANYTPPSGATVSYQWKRDSKNITGATGETYVVTDGDVGKKITVIVTASDVNHTGLLTSNSVTANKAEQEKPARGEGYTINFNAEMITAKEGYELAESQNSPTGQVTLTATPGTDVCVRKAETAAHEPSGWTSVDVPARPAAPSGVGKVDEAFRGGNGKLTGVTAAMQYRLEGATTWTDCENVQNGEVSLAPGTYKVRLKATTSAFASAETSSLKINAGAARTYTLELTAPVFVSVKVGYAQPAAKNLVIKGTGNSDTTVTGVTLSGDNANAFVLNKTDGTTITAGSTDSATYTIRPAAGLSDGIYTAVVTAAYDNGGTEAAATAKVTFIVQAEQLAGGSSSGGSSGNPVYLSSNGTWHMDQTGWWFEKTGGGYPADTWYACVWNNEKHWYHFNTAGYLDSGWFTDKDGNTYFLHDLHDGRFGHMYAGWHWIGGRCYYFNAVSGFGGLPYGALLRDQTTPDGYTVDGQGQWTADGTVQEKW